MNIIRPADELLDQPFWSNLANGTLQLNCCESCNAYRHPPGPVCPKCRTIGNIWKPVSGGAKLHSFTTVMHPVHPRLSDATPYIITLVDLDEGPRMVSGIPQGMQVDLQVGMRLQCQIISYDMRFALPYFLPAGQDQNER